MIKLEYIQEEEMIIDAIEHFKRVIKATTDTEEKYNEGFVDGLEFCATVSCMSFKIFYSYIFFNYKYWLVSKII